jgi:hypothetical protein
MEFVVEHWTSAGPYVAEEDDREEDGLGDSELRVEGAVWKEAAEESRLERSTGGEGNGATAATKEVMGGNANEKIAEKVARLPRLSLCSVPDEWDFFEEIRKKEKTRRRRK